MRRSAISKWSHSFSVLSNKGFCLLSGALLAISLALAGCSSDSGKTGSANPPPIRDNAPQPIYGGPPARDADVQNFKINLWENLANPTRCGACHGVDGESPQFARSDNINTAYDIVLNLVQMETPSESALVDKVQKGHNCWTQSTDFCAERVTTWIRNWVYASGIVPLTEASLKRPNDFPVSASLTFPSDTAAFAQHVYPLLRQYCADCHRADAPQAPVQPYFASSDVAAAYAAAQTKMLFNVQGSERDASRSRLVVRLREEAHNCWDNNCFVAGNTMEAALEAFAASMEMRPLDDSLLTSKAMGINDGTAVSQKGRVESNAIALYTFKEGKGTEVNDTSTGFSPELTLNLIGDVEWLSNWGVRINNGRLQGAVQPSSKLYHNITQTGEYSIEAWVVPADVNQGTALEPARIVSYSGSNSLRNFTIGQAEDSYLFFNRTSTTNADGRAALATPQGALQASQQHVVATYDATEGRKLYIGGELVEVVDPVAAGNINQWDQTFALVLGNETSGEYPWRGTIRLLAIHNRALTLDQVFTNYEAGVGQKILLAFSISDLIDGMDDAYIVFQVEQFDEYSYLFTDPYFFSFTETPTEDIVIRGLRIGVNGREAGIGQVFANLDVTISAEDYDPEEGAPLLSTKLGAVIEAEKGRDQDQFFLSFDAIGTRTRERVEEPVPPPPEPADLDPQPRIGVRTFAEINASFSVMTGIPVTDEGVVETYETVKQQMPPTENIRSFLVAHQMGITQLAVKYCNTLATSPARMQAYFPNFSDNRFDAAGRDALIDPLLKALLAHHIPAHNEQLADQPFEMYSRERLNDLIDTMTASCAGNVCSPSVARNTVTAVCAAALGSAVMLVQ
jgi:mono/diheme cytochrome c family protein